MPARTFTILLILLGSALSLAGCGGASAAPVEGENRLQVVTTIGMVTDITREIAGDRADVVGLLGAGVDPHLYAPTRGDVLRMLSADVVLYCGLLLEGKMTDALVRAATSGRKVYAVTERIDPAYLLEPEAYNGHHDPHVWMDPQAWAKAVEVVRDALIESDPDGRSVYETNASAFLARIDGLVGYAQQVLATVPESQRVLVTAHDAFNYFGRRYGFEVVGIQGLSTESEAGVRDIERLVDLIVKRNVPAVFVESTVSERNIKALVAGAKARGHEVTIGGELFSDAMGVSGSYEGTYIGMIDHNVTTIARSLGGEAPSRGMDGKLSHE